MVLVLLMLIKKYWNNLIEAKQSPDDANLTKYGLIKELSFTIILFKKWLKDNDIEMYSINNEGKSIAAERFIRTLKNKIYKHRQQYQKMCILIN